MPNYVECNFVRKLLSGHTHPAECSTWTTKVVGVKAAVRSDLNYILLPSLSFTSNQSFTWSSVKAGLT